MGYKILSQGILDGACFMYSIMNSYKMLTCPDVDAMQFKFSNPEDTSGRQKWKNIIKICPQAKEMLAGHYFHELLINMTTLNIDIIIDEHYDYIVKTAFDILSDKEFQFKANKISIKDITNNDFSKSVIILGIVNLIDAEAGNKIGGHFISINGIEHNYLHIACSFSIHTVEQNKYYEKYDKQMKYFYNNMIRIEDINENNLGHCVNSIYKIERTI